MTANLMLDIQQVTKRFGGLTAVNGLSLAIAPRSIVSVIGPNGAGKTTFFNCITGFYKPEEGQILLDGRPISGLARDVISRMGISRTYQNIRLFANMSAIENVMVGRHNHLRANLLDAVLRTPRFHKEESESEAEANRLLNFVGLHGLGNHLARNLPYGAQRRLEIARALANQPKLLLLDEPTAGMNPNETAEMTAFIRNLRDKLGITILLIEHDMRVVMGISDRVAVLDFGTKIAEGTPREIQHNPKVVEAYLGRGAAGAVPADLVKR